jgi:hypothetical protein
VYPGRPTAYEFSGNTRPNARDLSAATRWDEKASPRALSTCDVQGELEAQGRLAMKERSPAAMTAGLDLGDRFSNACGPEVEGGEVKSEWRMPTTRSDPQMYITKEGDPSLRQLLV